ncbi:MAG: leucine-rich repeat domain-containing protein [Lachnospiraceae bacterium]|nr:leucine-rich repeat domain-containing protein [Lachnospiraceae bacterium]MBR4608047.1 leucine-rich repeat domain-containing protein [Lachnospiraceae bacterium]
MKKKALAILLLSVALSLSACGQSANNTDNNKDIAELESRIAELEKENNELKGQSESTQTTESSKSELDNFVAETSGVCGENLTWEYGNGILYIHGTGAMSAYDVSSNIGKSKLPTPWLDIREKIAKVIIEDGCTSIGDSAFEECIALSSITIPDSVTTIGKEVFCGCDNLKSLTIPNSVKNIDLSMIDALEIITLPDDLTIISGALWGETAASGDFAKEKETITSSQLEQLKQQLREERIKEIEQEADKNRQSMIYEMFRRVQSITWKGKTYSSSEPNELFNDFISSGVIFQDVEEWRTNRLNNVEQSVEQYIKNYYTIVD